jgi:hypothetical protein
MVPLTLSPWANADTTCQVCFGVETLLLQIPDTVTVHLQAYQLCPIIRLPYNHPEFVFDYSARNKRLYNLLYSPNQVFFPNILASNSLILPNIDPIGLTCPEQDPHCRMA